MAEGCLTARRTCRAGAKAGHSDPVVLYGRAIAQRIKGTPGITGLFLPRVHIDGGVWHLDVGPSHPGAVGGPKGSAVRRLKWYASWVQTGVSQVGPYLLWAQPPWTSAAPRLIPRGGLRSAAGDKPRPTFVGDHSGRETPDPIPNSAVKPA